MAKRKGIIYLTAQAAKIDTREALEYLVVKGGSLCKIAGREQEIDEQWIVAGGKKHVHTGERKMLYDILDDGEAIEGMLGGTFRQDTDRLHRHKGVVVATSKRVIFVDKGVFGSSEVMNDLLRKHRVRHPQHGCV